MPGSTRYAIEKAHAGKRRASVPDSVLLVMRQFFKGNKAKLPIVETIDHSGYNVRGERQPVVTQIISGATNAPKAKAAVNAFTFALDLLGKTPLPGISAATSAIVQVIHGFRDMSDVREGWERLVDRLERLWYLVHEICRVFPNNPRCEELCTPLVMELYKLAEDLNKASKQGKLVAFFNGTEDLFSIYIHTTTLDSLVEDLTLAVCIETHKTTSQIRNECQKMIAQARQEETRPSEQVGVTTRLTKSRFINVNAVIGSDNSASGGARIMQSAEDCVFEGVTGALFSNNHVYGYR